MFLSMQVWIFPCYEKGADAFTDSIVFWIKDIFVSVSNRKVNSVTTKTTRRFIIASAWALLSLIFCSVKSGFTLILLPFNRQLYKTQKITKNVSIPAMSLATSCAVCVARVKLETRHKAVRTASRPFYDGTEFSPLKRLPPLHVHVTAAHLQLHAKYLVYAPVNLRRASDLQC